MNDRSRDSICCGLVSRASTSSQGSQCSRDVDPVPLVKIAKISFTAEDYRLLGVVLGSKENANPVSVYSTVVAFIRPGSDAERAGLYVSATLIMINGVSLKYFTHEEVLGLLSHQHRSSQHLVFEQEELNFKMDTRLHSLTQFPPPSGKRHPSVQIFKDTKAEHAGLSTAISSPTRDLVIDGQMADGAGMLWMPDSSTKQCVDCGRKFSLWWRRHHCRSCGQIFCSQCVIRMPKSVLREPARVSELSVFQWLRKELVCYFCCDQLQRGLRLDLEGEKEVDPAVFTSSEMNRQARQEEVSGYLSTHANDSLSEVGEKFLPTQPEHLRETGTSTAVTRRSKLTKRASQWNFFKNAQIITPIKTGSNFTQVVDLQLKGGKEGYKKMPDTRRPAIKRSSSDPSLDTMINKGRHIAQQNSQMAYKSQIVVRDTLDTYAEFSTAIQTQTLNASDSKRRKQTSTCEAATIANVYGITGETDPTGLSDSAKCVNEIDAVLERQQAKKKVMLHDLRSHAKHATAALVRKSNVIPKEDQEAWIEVINQLAAHVGLSVSPQPHFGETRDIMLSVRIKCFSSGKPTDSKYIDGVVFHKTVARRSMKHSIPDPKVLIISSSLESRRYGDQIISLDSVATQDFAYMTLLVRKIMRVQPDILLLGGHTDSVAESLLSKKGVTVVKNVKEEILKRIARSTGAAILTSADHVDKLPAKEIIGKCGHFEMTHFQSNSVRTMLSRNAKWHLVFSGCDGSRGCTVILRGGPPDVLTEVKAITSYVTRLYYNSRLQISLLCDLLLEPPERTFPGQQNCLFGDQLNTFATSSSLYLDRRNARQYIDCNCKKCRRLALFAKIWKTSPSKEVILRPRDQNDLTSNSAPILPQGRLVQSSTFSALPEVADQNTQPTAPLHVQIPLPTAVEAPQLPTFTSILAGYAASADGTVDVVALPPSSTSNTVTSSAALEKDGYMQRNFSKHGPAILRHEFSQGILRQDVSRGIRSSHVSALSDQEVNSRLVVSCCWKGPTGKLCSAAEIKCINFYQANDYTLREFLMKQCFDMANKCRTCKLPFAEHEFTFSHDTGRLCISVSDSRAKPDSLDAADNPEFALHMIQSDRLHMWGARNYGKSKAELFSIMSVDTQNFSFGKFLEDVFYNCGMKFHPQAGGNRGYTTDPSYVRYFSYKGLIARFHYEPFLLMKELTLRPTLWGRGRKTQRLYLSNVHTVDVLVHEVFQAIVPKLDQYLADDCITENAKSNLQKLKTTVYFWKGEQLLEFEKKPLVTAASLIDANKKVGEVYMQILSWNKIIGDQFQMPVKVVVHEESRQSAYDLWKDDLPSEGSKVGSSTSDERDGNKANNAIPPPSELHSFSLPKPERNSKRDETKLGRHRKGISFSENYREGIATSQSMRSSDSKKDHSSRSGLSAGAIKSSTPSVDRSHVNGSTNTPQPESLSKNLFGSSTNLQVLDHAMGLPDGSLHDLQKMSAKYANQHGGKAKKEGFDRLPPTGLNIPSSSYGVETTTAKPDAGLVMEASRGKQGIGDSQAARESPFVSIPKSLAQWNPQLPLCCDNTVVLVNEAEPTSIISYTLCSIPYIEKLEKQILEFCGLMWKVSPFSIATSSQLMENVKLLKCPARTDIKNAFGNNKFYCRPYYAMQFYALRKIYLGGDKLFVESLSRCQTWASTGGKSRATFMKTLDDRFIIKEIPEPEANMFVDMAPSYFEYMARAFVHNRPTMLCKALGVYEIITKTPNGNDKKIYLMVQENLMYGRETRYIFDLKGKLDGRFVREREGTRLDGNLLKYSRGYPTPVNEQAYALMRCAVDYDTAFLKAAHVTDYSMLIGFDVAKQELVAGIIDYFHQYNMLKRLEYLGKRVLQQEHEITILNPEDYCRRFRRAIRRYFTAVPSRESKPLLLKSDTVEAEPQDSIANATASEAGDETIGRPSDLQQLLSVPSD